MSNRNRIERRTQQINIKKKQPTKLLQKPKLMGSEERSELCEKNRISSLKIYDEYTSYQKTKNVLPYQSLNSNEFTIAYEIGRAFTQIFAEANFFNTTFFSYSGKDHGALLNHYGNPNVSCGLYRLDKKRYLTLVISGSKPESKDLFSFQQKMTNLVARINEDNSNENHLVLKELLRIYNLELNVVTHNSSTSENVISEEWNQEKSKNSYLANYSEQKQYTCSEPTLYRTLKALEKEGATILGTVHFSVIFALNDNQKNLQLHIFHPHSSCKERCQPMEKTGSYKKLDSRLALNLSQSDHRKQFNKRSSCITALPFPTRDDELLQEIKKIENGNDYINTLAIYAIDKNNIKIYESLEKAMTIKLSNEFGENEYHQLIGILTGNLDFSSYFPDITIKKSIIKSIIINRLLCLAISTNKLLNLDELANCIIDNSINQTKIVAYLCNHEKMEFSGEYNEGDARIISDFIAKSIKNIREYSIKDILKELPNLDTINKLKILVNNEDGECVDLLFNASKARVIKQFIKYDNKDNSDIQQLIEERIVDIISVCFRNNINTLNDIILCYKCANNDQYAIKDLEQLILKRISEEACELLKLTTIDLHKYIPELIKNIDFYSLEKYPNIFSDYLLKIQSDILYKNTKNISSIFDAIEKYENSNIEVANKIILEIENSVSSTHNELENINSRLAILSDEIKKNNASKSSSKNSNKQHKIRCGNLSSTSDICQKNISETNDLNIKKQELTLKEKQLKKNLKEEQQKLFQLGRQKKALSSQEIQHIIQQYSQFINIPEPIVQCLLENNPNKIASNFIQAILNYLQRIKNGLANNLKEEKPVNIKIVINKVEKIEQLFNTLSKYASQHDMQIIMTINNLISEIKSKELINTEKINSSRFFSNRNDNGNNDDDNTLIQNGSSHNLST